MLHTIEDPLGQRWFVGKGDPAFPAVQKLRSLHYTWIVLPRATIMGVGVDHGIDVRLIHWRPALRAARKMGYNTDRGQRHIRLAECLQVLGG